MRQLTLEVAEQPVPHYLYDLSLPIEERPLKKQWFKSGAAAANFIGVPPNRIWDKRKTGEKIYSPKYEKYYAIRIAGK